MKAKLIFKRNLHPFAPSALLTVVLLLGLVVTFVFYALADRAVHQAYEYRHRSLLLAEELRRSSNDLTRMAQTFVVTGDPALKAQFDQIMAIRDGTLPRPKRYDSIYWEVAERKGANWPHGGGAPIALLDLIQRMGLEASEVALLQVAKERSDRLAVIEREAMQWLDRGADREPNQHQAQEMLFGADYFQAKAAIMAPINEFVVRLERRTLAAVETAQHRALVLQVLFIAFGLSLLLSLARAGILLRKVLGAPAAEVRRQITKLGQGDFAAPALLQRVPKNSVLGWLAETRARLQELAQQRQQTAEQLRISEARHRILADNAQDVIWTMAFDGTITYVSPAVEALRGFTPEEAARQPLEEVLTEASQAMVQAYFLRVQTALAEGSELPSFRGELEYRCRDGSTIWTDVVALPLFSPTGSPLELVGMTRDITVLKRSGTEAREREQQMRKLFQHLPVAIAVANLDFAQSIMFYNARFEQTFGYSSAQIPTPADWMRLAYPEDDYRREVQSAWANAVAEAVQHHGLIAPRECSVIRVDGECRQVLISATVIDGLIISAFDDITERRSLEAQLRASETRHRLWADQSVDFIWTMGLDGVFTYVSPSVEHLFGYTPEEFQRNPLSTLFPPDTFVFVQEEIAYAAQNVKSGVPVDFKSKGIKHQHKNGSIVWAEVTAIGLYDDNGTFMELMGITRDISERKRIELELLDARDRLQQSNHALQAANMELRRLATTDQLTAVWNRRHFEERLAIETVRADRYADPLVLILFDIDHFKMINDTFGHVAGDQVLIEITRRTQSRLRESDLLARWGGEEFVLLMPHSGIQEGMHLAEELRSLIADQVFPTVGTVTASFGVSEHHPREHREHWIRRTDQALYAAKDTGRNTVVQAE